MSYKPKKRGNKFLRYGAKRPVSAVADKEQTTHTAILFFLH